MQLDLVGGRNDGALRKKYFESLDGEVGHPNGFYLSYQARSFRPGTTSKGRIKVHTGAKELLHLLPCIHICWMFIFANNLILTIR